MMSRSRRGRQAGTSGSGASGGSAGSSRKKSVSGATVTQGSKNVTGGVPGAAVPQGKKSITEGVPGAAVSKMDKGKSGDKIVRNGSAGSGKNGAAGMTNRTDQTAAGGSGSAKKDRPDAADVRDAVYSTRYYMWALLISGWLFTSGASITRGQMPEIFVAVVLTGIILQGLFPVLAAKAARLALSRELSSVEASAGGELKVKLALRSRIPLPLLWISLRETLVNDCGAQSRTVQFRHITLPWSSLSWRIHYTVRGLERGEYHFRPMEAVFGDMLGLTAVRLTIRAPYPSVHGDDTAVSPSFLVLPAWHGADVSPGYGARLASVQESKLSVPTAGGNGLSENGGRKTRSNIQRTTADRGGTQRVPYRPGDDARRIDWRTAARGGIWMTKREWTTRPPELLVVLDTSSDSYNDDDRLFDQSAGYAAELVRHAASERVPFRLLGMTSAAKGARGAAGTHRSIEREALERLARVRPVTEAWAGETLALVGGEHQFPRGATIVVVTAEWRSGALGERLAALAAANGCRSEVHVLTSNKVPSIAMRERKRDWESAGIRVVWAVTADDEAMPNIDAVMEGGEANDSANG